MVFAQIHILFTHKSRISVSLMNPICLGRVNLRNIQGGRGGAEGHMSEHILTMFHH